MLEHFCECYSDLSGPILCPVLGSITPLFIPNSRIRPIRLIGLCASLITFLYSPVPRIQFDPSTAKSQFVESLRWLPYENINFYLGIDGISLFFVILTTFLIPICISVGWSGMRSYGKVYYSISNSWISNDRRVPHAGSPTILCSSRKRANPYVVRS